MSNVNGIKPQMIQILLKVPAVLTLETITVTRQQKLTKMEIDCSWIMVYTKENVMTTGEVGLTLKKYKIAPLITMMELTLNVLDVTPETLTFLPKENGRPQEFKKLYTTLERFILTTIYPLLELLEMLKPVKDILLIMSVTLICYKRLSLRLQINKKKLLAKEMITLVMDASLITSKLKLAVLKLAKIVLVMLTLMERMGITYVPKRLINVRLMKLKPP